MNCPVALQSTRAGPELTSAMSVVWISTLMTRDFGVGVAAITYLFGSRFSHRLIHTQGSFGSCSGFSVTVSGCSVREGGMGIISFSGSKTENLLYTGSGGTQFTHCGLQNPLLLLLLLWALQQSQS